MTIEGHLAIYKLQIFAIVIESVECLSTKFSALCVFNRDDKGLCIVMVSGRCVMGVISNSIESRIVMISRLKNSGQKNTVK